MNETERQDKAMEIVAIVGRAIKDFGSIPSGHLYAHLPFSLETYQQIITILKKANCVEEKNHLLTWIGDRDNDRKKGQDSATVSNNNNGGSSHVAGGDEQGDLPHNTGGETGVLG